MRESEERFRSLTQLSSDMYWEQDEEYRFTSMSGSGSEHIARRTFPLLGKRRWDRDYVNMTQQDWARHIAVLDARQPFHDMELCRVEESGKKVWISVSGAPMFDEAGVFRGYRGVGKDITERKRSEELRALEHAVNRDLADAEDVHECLKAVIRTVCESEAWDCGRYFSVDEDAQVLRYAAAWGLDDPAIQRFVERARELVFRQDEGLSGCAWKSGQPLWSNDVTKDPRSLTAQGKRGIASEIGIHGTFVFPVVADGKTMGVLNFSSRQSREPEERLLDAIRVIGRQIGQFLRRKQGEEKLAYLAQFDSLTGLPNRHLFRDRLMQAMARSKRSGNAMAVLFIDLDRFKLINDTLGHSAGDRLLKEATQRLQASVRASDTVGRFGGDEFGAIIADLAKPADASVVAQKIIDVLAQPFHLDGHESYVTASVGITLFPTDGDEAGTLIMNADAAMYRAKEQGRNTYQYFTREMNERAMQRVKMETALRRAIERREFLLHYQPKVKIGSGELCGFEALLRWQQPERGLVPPLEFIPILEDTGLIVPVGEWVIEEVCAQIGRWQASGFRVPPVAINLSARQFQQKGLDETVRRVLGKSGVDAALIHFELTESLLMKEPEAAAKTLRGLKELGVMLSVDDFGTGYSSLSYLKRFPIDALKIDRAFIRDVTVDPDDAAITFAIIGLAHSLKLNVIAEGVETRDQLDFLETHGCDEMQGFLFSRPVPAEECARMLSERRRLGASRRLRAQGGRG
jgi:diguanylate cyclase (GGDEF)-like protein/PAS domain S-box-containing protein